jgi:predicted transcriptional regulator
VIGNENGIRGRELAEVLRVDASGVSERREAARRRVAGSEEMKKLLRAMRSGV